MLFSFLSFPVPGSLASHRQPWPALLKDADLPGSLAETLPECAQELGRGKGSTGKKGPGRTREAVGGLRPRSPVRARPGPVWHKLLPGSQAAEQRPAPTHTRPFVGGKHKGEGNILSSVLTEEADSSWTPGPARNSRGQGWLESAK